jgi:hypothetical protein
MNVSRQTFPFSAAVSVALGGLFAARSIFAPYPVEEPFTGGMPLAARLAGFSAANPGLSAVVVAIIILWIILAVVHIAVRYASATNRNYLPFQFFVIAACGICLPGELLASFLAAWLLVLSTKYFIESFRKDYRFEDVFRAGLFLGAIPLLYAPGVILLLLIPVALSLYRRSSREFIVCLAGVLLPVPVAGFLHWAFGEMPSMIYTEIWRCLSVRPAVEYPAQFPVTAAVAAGLVMALALAAVVWFLAHRKGMRTRQRNIMSHVSYMLVLVSVSAALPGASLSIIPLVSIPVAMAVPYSFFGKQALVLSIVYIVMLCAVLTLNVSAVAGVSLP